MDKKRINTDGEELAQYVENILVKGKLPNYVGEKPLVFPVCIGANDYGSFYQLECKCQIRGNTYSKYPEQISAVFPKCAKCIKEINRWHKKTVYEEKRQAKKARKQAHKEEKRSQETRNLPIWAQWLLRIILSILTVLLTVFLS